MDVTGEERIAAPPEVVWAALNDPDILRQCIPGCQSVTRESPTEFSLVIRVRLWPISASFAGTIRLSNVDAPWSYTMSGEGKGGVAGFAKGSADVRLEADGGGTLLTYAAGAEIGGKLAQLGSRFIGSSARKLGEKFFSDFNAAVIARTAAPL